MKLEDIYQFFENHPPTYICQELAVCYILSILQQGESYGTELIQKLETEYPTYRLSDTVLYSAIKFLENHKAITGYWKKLEGRGRPRRMYQISQEWQTQAQDLARLWQDYINRRLSNDLEKRKEILYKYYSQKNQIKKEYIAFSFSKIEDINNFFENPPPTYLCQELAVCYILAALSQGDSYGTELIQRLENQYPDLRLSDSILYSAIEFLENNNAITHYYKKIENRARPRRIYKITPEWEMQARDLARLWHQYVNTQERVDVINALGDDYNASGEFYKAIEYYQKSLVIAEEIDYGDGKVLSLLSLGNAYSKRIKGNRADDLENAINAYNSALTVCTREDFPQDCAKIQNGLGDAYSHRIRGEKAENLEIAITFYNQALKIYTYETFPQDWAKIQNGLGDAYSHRIRGEKAENLEIAIAFYNQALKIYTYETFPQDWAKIQNGLGLAYNNRIKGERAENLEQAIVAFKNTLTVYTHEALPYYWAMIHKNLGNSYLQRLLGDKTSNVETAITYYQSALKVYNRETFPSEWASICKNIGNAYIQKIQDDSLTTIEALDTIEYAILYYKDALKIHKQEEFPNEYSTVMERLVNASYLYEHCQINLEEANSHRTIRLDNVISESRLRIERAIDFIIYSVLLNCLENINIGEEIEIAVNLKQASKTGDGYFLQIPQNDAIANELNIILKAPGFILNGGNSASLPLDPNTVQGNQTATFHLTALRPGNATITAELYRGDTFETTLETQVQVADFDEATFTPQRITTQPRPVSQPDFILRIQTIENETSSTCKFQYQLKSFRLPSLFPGNNIYTSSSLSSSWIEQVRGLLATTLENISGSLSQERKFRLISLGQYLFNHLFPTELQSDIRSLIPRNSTFTILILTNQDTSIPWELLHDGQRFLAERFIIGRWLSELNDTRPYEFPVGAVNVAHYANVEQPELWATLLQPPGAPPPQPLPEGLLHDSTEAIRGLHLIRYSHSEDVTDMHNAPVRLDNASDAEDIETKIRPTKLNLRRNRPFVTLSYVKTDVPELTELEQTWASPFIRAGCSGFAGSLWAVEPSVEAAFISSFYNSLWAGASLGEAFYTSRQLARAVVPDSLDWLAYVLFGDPMARPYLPVEGKGYAVVEPIGREIEDPLSPNVPIRFRLSLRRTPPVWHQERVIEVAENLTFENLQVHVKTMGLQVTPDSPIEMNLAPNGNYLGWFTLVAPPEMVDNSALVQVYFMDGEIPIHSLMFSLTIENNGGE